MKLCRVNLEGGGTCNEPVTSGGYCKYHQHIQYCKPQHPVMKHHNMKKHKVK